MAGTSDPNRSSLSPTSDEAAEARDTVPDNSSVPKPKRLACMICRKRKLKCDGVRPSCSTCSRLGHACAYDEQRRKSGPKRGYVKALEERLKHVETLLKTQDPPSASTSIAMNGMPPAAAVPQSAPLNMPNGAMNGDHEAWKFANESPAIGNVDGFNSFSMGVPDVQMGNMGNAMGAPTNMNGNMATGNTFTWEMIGLGLEEPLPPQDTIDELHQIYFEKVHASMPMIHRARYLSAMNLAPHQRPPVCLRYAMWTMACSITDKYADLKDLFYQRARKYVEGDYVKGYGEHMISVAHCQTHVLLACYEIKMMYFPRAWINTGSAVRLAQMIGLHRQDGTSLDVKQCLPPANDWTEREERRRTFWMAFCEDRYASIGTGWPMTIDERDITTKLPASEEAFEMSRPEPTLSLEEATTPAGAAKLTSFGGIVLLAALFGRNLTHLHRPDSDDRDHDTNGPFWKRHRDMDRILTDTLSLNLPPHLKLPAGLPNPNVIFTNMSIHTSTICLHQAAIFKAEKNKLAMSYSVQSKTRCITAAKEIAGIMRTISHMDLSAMNPYISFCLYVAARVFIQYLKSRPDDDQTVDSLRFLLSAMTALKRRNPLTESFLVQLDVDFEALGEKVPHFRHVFFRPESPNLQGDAAAGPSCTAANDKGIFQHHETEFDDSKSSSADAMDGQAAAAAAAESDKNGTYTSHWMSAENKVLTPNSNGMYDRMQAGRVISSPEGPTPNSSSSGGDRGPMMDSPAGRQNVHYRTDGFPDTSAPAVPQGQMPVQGGFFPMPGAGVMPTGAAPQTYGQFQVTGSYSHMGMQDAIETSPGGEDMLKAILNMGPMAAMDLSSWGNTGAMGGEQT